MTKSKGTRSMLAFVSGIYLLGMISVNGVFALHETAAITLRGIAILVGITAVFLTGKITAIRQTFLSRSESIEQVPLEEGFDLTEWLEDNQTEITS